MIRLVGDPGSFMRMMMIQRWTGLAAIQREIAATIPTHRHDSFRWKVHELRTFFPVARLHQQCPPTLSTGGLAAGANPNYQDCQLSS